MTKQQTPRMLNDISESASNKRSTIHFKIHNITKKKKNNILLFVYESYRSQKN